MPFSKTVTDPSSQSVGSGPIENINRRIIDATRVRIPDSRGNVITMANDESIITQITNDMWECNSLKENKN